MQPAFSYIYGMADEPLMKAEERKVLYSPLEYSEGVLTLARRVDESIRAIKANSVVIRESTSSALDRVWDGGLTAGFACVAKQNEDRLAGFPVAYGVPEVNVYSICPKSKRIQTSICDQIQFAIIRRQSQ